MITRQNVQQDATPQQRNRQQRDQILMEFELAGRNFLTALGMLFSFILLLILGVGHLTHALIGISNYFLSQLLAWVSTREIMRAYAKDVVAQGGRRS